MSERSELGRHGERSELGRHGERSELQRDGMTGAVYDRGYRGYEGTRGGQGSARAALFRASVRRALGIRRPWRQKVAPFVLLGIVTIPAIVNVGVAYLTRDRVGPPVEIITRSVSSLTTHSIPTIAPSSSASGL